MGWGLELVLTDFFNSLILYNLIVQILSYSFFLNYVCGQIALLKYSFLILNDMTDSWSFVIFLTVMIKMYFNTSYTLFIHNNFFKIFLSHIRTWSCVQFLKIFTKNVNVYFFQLFTTFIKKKNSNKLFFYLIGKKVKYKWEKVYFLISSIFFLQFKKI